MSQAMIMDVTMNNIQEMVMQNSKRLPVLISFWSPMNEQSKLANTILEKLANEFAGQFILAKINSDQQTEISEKFSLPSIPFIKLIKNQNIVTEKQGLLSETEYRQAIQEHIEADPSEEIRQQANQAFTQGNIEQAIELFGTAAKANPNNFQIHLDLVMLYLQTGHLDKADNLFQKLPEEAQQDPRGKELDGVLFFSKLIEDKADIEDIKSRLETNPNDCEALYLLSAFLMLNGQAENALQTLFKLFLADRTYESGTPQKTIIKAFDMLNHKAPDLVNAYRRKFQSLLF